MRTDTIRVSIGVLLVALMVGSVSCQGAPGTQSQAEPAVVAQEPEVFTKELIGTVEQANFSQAVVVHSGRVKTIYVSGQIGIGGDDLSTQAVTALENLVAQLARAGATKEDLVSMTTYVVDYAPADAQVCIEAMKQVLGDVYPAWTLLGVQALAAPDLRIEISAVAVING